MNKIKYEQLPTPVRVAIQFFLILLSMTLIVAAIVGLIFLVVYIVIPYIEYVVGVVLIGSAIVVAIDADKERMEKIRIKKVAASIHKQYPLVSPRQIINWLNEGYSEGSARTQAMIRHEKEKLEMEQYRYREKMAEEEFSNVKYRR